MKDELIEVKAVFVAFFTFLNIKLGSYAMPIYMLLCMEILDYITGIWAAPYRDEKITSYKSFRGILKKVCILLLVGVGIIIDWLILYAGDSIGINLNDIGIKYAFTSVIAIWLIANEIISFLENLIDIGVAVPSFLKTAIDKIKSSTDDYTQQ
ncbi:MAG: phage holin family protein [Clostridia bacterium]